MDRVEEAGWPCWLPSIISAASPSPKIDALTIEPSIPWYCQGQIPSVTIRMYNVIYYILLSIQGHVPLLHVLTAVSVFQLIMVLTSFASVQLD